MKASDETNAVIPFWGRYEYTIGDIASKLNRQRSTLFKLIDHDENRHCFCRFRLHSGCTYVNIWSNVAGLSARVTFWDPNPTRPAADIPMHDLTRQTFPTL